MGRNNRRGGRGRGSRNRNRNNRNNNQNSRKSKYNLDDLIGRMSDYTAIQPVERIRLETDRDERIGRVIDMITPIGKGQRCLITSPPKAGKTTILHAIAKAVHKNHPEIEQVALLVDERPEEATDFKRNVPVNVIASTADHSPKNHIRIAEEVFGEALTKLLEGKDVLILLDSITRLARAYNVMSGSGKILSGGVTAGALDRPRQLFGAARKLEEGGSLTIVATALVETGSLMDEVIFQEFKGTGNLELILDRQLSQRRLFPAVNVNPSGTRRELDLLNELETLKVPALRRQLADMGKEESINWLLKRIKKTHSNKELLGSVHDL
jgi:transcription termination factor Rho